MKKVLAGTLSLALCFSLAACGAETAAPTETTIPVSAEAAETLAETEMTTIATTEATEPAPVLTVEEQVIWDAEDLKITVTGIDMENAVGPTLKLKIENSSSKVRSVMDTSCAVNSCMIQAVFFAEAKAGETIDADFTLFQSDLKAAGIKDLADVQVCFMVVSDSNLMDTFQTEMLPVKTSVTGVAEPAYDASGEVVYEDDSVRILYKGIGDLKILYRPCAVVTLENKTDHTVTFKAEEVTLGGTPFISYSSFTVTSGMRAIAPIYFEQDELDAAGITELKDIVVNFIVEGEDYSSPKSETGAIALDQK